MNLIPKLVGIIVAVILTATIMVPIIDDAIKSNKTEYKNSPTGQSAYFMDEGDTLTIEFDGTTQPLLNGSLADTKDIAFFASDNMYIQYFSGPKQCRACYWDGSSVVLINGVTELDLTITDKTVNGTIVKGSTNTTTTLTNIDLGDWAAYASNEGNYVMITPATTQTFYINDIDQMYGTGEKTVSSTVFVSFDGNSAAKNGTATEPTYTTTKVTGYEDLYTLSTADYTIDSESTLIWLSPKVIYGTEEEDAMLNNLIATIPIFAIIGIIIGALGLIVTRDD